MKWLRFSLRSLLLVVALAGLASLGLRWYRDRPYARVERAMEIVWRDSPHATIFFDQSAGEFYVEGATLISNEAVKALVDAEQIRIGQITSQPGGASFEINQTALDLIQTGYEHLSESLRSRNGVEMIHFAREYEANPEKMVLHFDAVYKNRVDP